jgi:monofunctional biosynthetic peptidoglycan transglycosylase
VVEVALSLPGGGRVEARLRRPAGAGAPRGAWAASAEVEAGPDDLPAAWRAGPLRATAGRLALAVEAEGGPLAGRASVRGALRGLVLAGTALGPEPVGPLSPAGEAQLSWSRREARVAVSRAVATLAGPLRVEASGTLTAADDLPFELALRVPPVDYRALVEALPPALAPPAAAPRPEGPVGGRLALSGPLRRPADWVVDGEVDLDGLREAARRAPPSPLRAPFTAHPDGEDGPGVVVGPENPAFVPIAELPAHVVRAVTVSEDAGFFAHRGFDFEELKNAFAQGTEAGRVVRGGSTITQQLAKNLYLSPSRNPVRKLRELFITRRLEASLSKRRILEIYLNMIEWGDGIFGCEAAARAYFGKSAAELSREEAALLAGAIINPRELNPAHPTRRLLRRQQIVLRRMGGG